MSESEVRPAVPMSPADSESDIVSVDVEVEERVIPAPPPPEKESVKAQKAINRCKNVFKDKIRDSCRGEGRAVYDGTEKVMLITQRDKKNLERKMVVPPSIPLADPVSGFDPQNEQQVIEGRRREIMISQAERNGEPVPVFEPIVPPTYATEADRLEALGKKQGTPTAAARLFGKRPQEEVKTEEPESSEAAPPPKAVDRRSAAAETRRKEKEAEAELNLKKKREQDALNTEIAQQNARNIVNMFRKKPDGSTPGSGEAKTPVGSRKRDRAAEKRARQTAAANLARSAKKDSQKPEEEATTESSPAVSSSAESVQRSSRRSTSGSTPRRPLETRSGETSSTSTPQPKKKRLTEGERLMNMDFGPKEGGTLGDISMEFSEKGLRKSTRTNSTPTEKPAEKTRELRRASRKPTVVEDDDTDDEEMPQEQQDETEAPEDPKTASEAMDTSIDSATESPKKKYVASMFDIGTKNGESSSSSSAEPVADPARSTPPVSRPRGRPPHSAAPAPVEEDDSSVKELPKEDATPVSPVVVPSPPRASSPPASQPPPTSSARSSVSSSTPSSTPSSAPPSASSSVPPRPPVYPVRELPHQQRKRQHVPMGGTMFQQQQAAHPNQSLQSYISGAGTPQQRNHPIQPGPHGSGSGSAPRQGGQLTRNLIHPQNIAPRPSVPLHVVTPPNGRQVVVPPTPQQMAHMQMQQQQRQPQMAQQQQQRHRMEHQLADQMRQQMAQRELALHEQSLRRQQQQAQRQMPQQQPQQRFAPTPEIEVLLTEPVKPITRETCGTAAIYPDHRDWNYMTWSPRDLNNWVRKILTNENGIKVANELLAEEWAGTLLRNIAHKEEMMEMGVSRPNALLLRNHANAVINEHERILYERQLEAYKQQQQRLRQ